MAKQLVNQLDLIQTLLEDQYLEKDNDAFVLYEKKIMKRRIVVHNGITHLLYKYDPDKIKIFPISQIKLVYIKYVIISYLLVKVNTCIFY